MRNVSETKEWLRRVADWRDEVKTINRAGDSLSRLGIDEKGFVEGELERTATETTEAVRTMLRLRPDEAQVLIARYVDGQPYETLNEHEGLRGMSQSTAWRLLARATEHLAEILT